MLDVSIRIGLLNVMKELRDTEGVSILYITHDLASARYVADRMIVLYAGRIVEEGADRGGHRSPRHPYTQLLMSTAPDPRLPLDVSTRASSDLGEPPKVIDPAPGCRFAPRCPLARDECRARRPADGRADPTHRAVCAWRWGAMGLPLVPRPRRSSRSWAGSRRGGAASSSTRPQWRDVVASFTRGVDATADPGRRPRALGRPGPPRRPRLGEEEYRLTLDDDAVIEAGGLAGAAYAVTTMGS